MSAHHLWFDCQCYVLVLVILRAPVSFFPKRICFVSFATFLSVFVCVHWWFLRYQKIIRIKCDYTVIWIIFIMIMIIIVNWNATAEMWSVFGCSDNVLPFGFVCFLFCPVCSLAQRIEKKTENPDKRMMCACAHKWHKRVYVGDYIIFSIKYNRNTRRRRQQQRQLCVWLHNKFQCY